MPREILIVSRHEVSAQAVADAALQVDASLSVQGGPPATVTVESARGQVVLRLGPSAQAHQTSDIGRLVPCANQPDGPTYWTEGWAPWGPFGEAGVAVAFKLATNLGATCVVEDGA
ncbi:MAG: hypothetical protein LBR19_03195 [Bifidobacteriaceae bacterium]|jgi:hypothetical protein|nr:hypothetical protein [Bifidobacteriaceae bacterium]